MKVLAIDTATERCSAALRIDGHTIGRMIDTPRGHADLILPMIEEVLSSAGVKLAELDGIAYGRGPGGFTGVRIAIGVVQGLAFGASLPTVGVSNLAAVAQQIASAHDRVLVCMDARMQEVYWGLFFCEPVSGLVAAAGVERVGAPQTVDVGERQIMAAAGTGFSAYPELAVFDPAVPIYRDVLPRASEIALLGEAALRRGEGRPAREAQPVYLRDQVAIARK